MRITLQEAARRLLHGDVIGVPTETVYGLAASIGNPQAIEQIFALKGRPRNNPLITHVASRSQINGFIENYPDHFSELCDLFWPGPLTLVIPVTGDKISSTIRADLPTAAFRLPAHPLTRDLINLTGPLVMPSANLSGKPSTTKPEHVEADFGADFPVLDGGACRHGLESTILICSGSQWVIGRLGAIAAQDFIPILGYEPQLSDRPTAENPVCPGQYLRHYAPLAKLHLSEHPPSTCEAVLGFSERTYPETKRLITMGSLASPASVAQNLYHNLRLLDQEGIRDAWVDMNFPSNGLWKSIRERLHRAAQKG